MAYTFSAKLFSVNNIPASDGSIIPREVVEEYLRSDKYLDSIRSRKAFGTLTHLARSSFNNKHFDNKPINKTIGKDDLMLLTGESSPTHIMTRVYIKDDGWCHGDFEVLDEEGLDDEAQQRIRRLTGLLKNGCRIGISSVIVGYWRTSTGNDYLHKLVELKGADLTLNPSWKEAGITEIYDENGYRVDEGDRYFSDTEDSSQGCVKVKTFSSFDTNGLYRTSKIDGQFTELKKKVFSVVTDSFINSESVSSVDDRGYYNSVNQPKQKVFSVASLKERLRYAKFSPKMRFRRLFIDYKQTVKQLGGVEKIDPDTLKVLKSLFTTDILDIIKSVSSEITQGKQINALIGASSLGKGVRDATSKLQLPYRMAMQEATRRGSISPNRYIALKQAYKDFVESMIEEVFGEGSLPEGLEETAENEENNIK